MTKQRWFKFVTIDNIIITIPERRIDGFVEEEQGIISIAIEGKLEPIMVKLLPSELERMLDHDGIRSRNCERYRKWVCPYRPIR